MAQDEDRGVLEAFLEDNLSDAGRDVQIEGFQGALSGLATMEDLTIADDTGIWLTIEDAVFDWNRGALFRGRLEITELSAQSVTVARAPVAAGGLPQPEATPFALPDLPVSILIASFEIADLTLGEPLLGEEARFSVDGGAVLDEGAGRARLDVTRAGGPAGRIDFDGSYSNTTKQLSLVLALSEARDGIAATLLGLPDRPSVDFQISGDGPIGDFTAAIRLSTEGQSRLAGTVSTASEEGTRRLAVDIGGDLRPLVEPQYRTFLGRDLRLTGNGTRESDGRIELQALSLRSDAMTLRGTAAVAADGWPERIDLRGRIAPVTGKDVLLSFPGPETRVSTADLTLAYDAASGDAWIFSADLDGFVRPELTLATARIAGQGMLSRDLERVDGALEMTLAGIVPETRDLARAIGSDLQGTVRFDWQKGGALQFSSLDLSGADYGLSGAATIDGVEGQIDLAITGDLRLEARDLSRFAGLTVQDLRGGADLRIKGEVAPVSGAFDIQLAGTGRELSMGQPQIDALIAGTTRISVAARRDTTGLTLDRLTITGDTARVSAKGDVSSDASDLEFDLIVSEAAQVLPGVSGQITLAGTAAQTGPIWRLDAKATAPGATEAQIAAVTSLVRGAPGPSSGEVTLQIGDLSAFASLFQRPVAGALTLTAEARGDLRDTTFSATLDGSGNTLRTGIAEADLLLRGQSSFSAALRREANAMTVFDRFELRTPQIIADLTGSVSEIRSRVRYSLDLRDMGLFVSDFSGPVTAQGVVSAGEGPWSVTSALTGPGGTTASVDGQVARDGRTANLAISGTAPLALMNRFIRPNLAEGTAGFDLRLSGPPGLNALSGTIRTGNARLTFPNLRLGLNAVSAEAQLGGGSARLSVRGGLAGGGRVSLDGRLALTAPYTADLGAQIDGAKISRAGLYETTVDGRLDILGALRGGAALTGALELGPTELRIPDETAASDGALPGLVHLNEPAAVRQTRVRAGLIATGDGGDGGVYPIDLTVNAPARIFVRGRGLDAELGGSLRLTGTTANVVTAGRFDLIRGRLDILGKRLALSEAYARLQGNLDPFIRAVASTNSAGTRVQVVVEGLASAPTITFTSSPDLPEDEILARLLFGRDLSQISPLQALQIANAVSVLVGQGGESIVGRLRQNFGLDDLDITTGEDGEAGLRVGKYINENVYTDVTVDTSGRSEIDLNLSVTPSITARGSLASDGGSSLGVFFERDY